MRGMVSGCQNVFSYNADIPFNIHTVPFLRILIDEGEKANPPKPPEVPVKPIPSPFT